MTKSDALTEIEVEALKLTALGHSAKTAGATLGITQNAFAGRIERVRRKLKINAAAMLVHYALAKGLVENLYAPLVEQTQ